MTHDPETIWADILSRDARRILAAWNDLASDEQSAVKAHLARMANESGWSEPQRISAHTALDVLAGPPPPTPENG